VGGSAGFSGDHDAAKFVIFILLRCDKFLRCKNDDYEILRASARRYNAAIADFSDLASAPLVMIVPLLDDVVILLLR
jgi:hypothetical protein